MSKDEILINQYQRIMIRCKVTQESDSSLLHCLWLKGHLIGLRPSLYCIASFQGIYLRLSYASYLAVPSSRYPFDFLLSPLRFDFDFVATVSSSRSRNVSAFPWAHSQGSKPFLVVRSTLVIAVLPFRSSPPDYANSPLQLYSNPTTWYFAPIYSPVLHDDDPVVLGPDRTVVTVSYFAWLKCLQLSLFFSFCLLIDVVTVGVFDEILRSMKNND